MKKHAKKFTRKEDAQFTISDLKRERGYGDYRSFIENMCAEMKENNWTPGDMVKVHIERLGHQFVSRGHIYVILDAMEKDPKTAIRDMRHVKSGRKKSKLTDNQNYALTLALAHYRHYDMGFPAALEELKEFRSDFRLEESDLPPLWRCYATWSGLTVIQKMALGDNYKEVFKMLGCWTHNPKCAPDDEHNFDEGKHSVRFAVQDSKSKKRIRVTISLQVDRSTFIIRMPHFSFEEFNERESILAAKKALLPAPEIDLEHGCIPKQIRCDNATFHKGYSFQVADEWLQNRSGRTGRIIYNPVAQPLANASAERAIGELKRKFLRKFLKDFLLYLEHDIKFQRPSMPGVVAHLDDLERLLLAFVKKHNNRIGKGQSIPRIQKYREEVPAESTSVTAEEIHRNVLYVRQQTISPNGVKIDGYQYGGPIPARYFDRSDTYVGVMPEGDSPFATVFVLDDETKMLKRVDDLELTDVSTTASPRSQMLFLEQFQESSAKNTPEAEHLKRILGPAMARKRDAQRQEFAQQKAAQRAARKAATAAARAKVAEPPIEPPPSEPVKPVRPQIQIRKAA